MRATYHSDLNLLLDSVSEQVCPGTDRYKTLAKVDDFCAFLFQSTGSCDNLVSFVAVAAAARIEAYDLDMITVCRERPCAVPNRGKAVKSGAGICTLIAANNSDFCHDLSPFILSDDIMRDNVPPSL
jgi:hypothetical protein